MMNTVYVDSPLHEDERRKLLFAGQLFVFSPTRSSLELVAFARHLITETFDRLDPETAQEHMPVEEYAVKLAALKPKFIHHERSKSLLQSMLKELGCDPEKTYFDVPRMRTATSDDYLSTGIAYAFHPHRDTWYSAPMCQLNWWIPIYQIQSGNSMAFHPRYWLQPVKNGSSEYNYQEWNKTSRFIAAQQIKNDTRKQPRPEEPMELDPQVRIVGKPGEILIFSGAQMHSTVPNNTGRTRFSIDFRTVNVDDVRTQAGAPNVDSECTGTTMGDYLRGSDLSPLPLEVTSAYDGGPPQVAMFSSREKRG